MTQKRIFISKGTLDLSRNREQRRLEAQLDLQEKNESNSLSKVLSGATKQNELGNNFQREVPRNADTHPANSSQRFEEETLDKIEKEVKEEHICIYYDNCLLHKYSMKCIFRKENCRSYQFYEKYKDFDFGRQLGI